MSDPTTASAEAPARVNVTPAPEAPAAPVIDDVQRMRDQIFNSNDLTSEIVAIKEWGGLEIEVRAMTGNERAEYLAMLQAQAPDGDMTKIDWKTFYPTLLASTCYAPARVPGGFALGESSTKVFRPDDVDRVNAKNSKAIERLAKVARRLSGMQDDEDDE